ncbi:helix-turn-helix domain-containing protein [Saccharopolyspora spinosporotrichia]
MDLDVAEPVRDRRVRRSRAALMRAAVELVTERGTAAVTLSDIAEAADVSRRVVYQHFGDRDAPAGGRPRSRQTGAAATPRGRPAGRGRT